MSEHSSYSAPIFIIAILVGVKCYLRFKLITVDFPSPQHFVTAPCILDDNIQYGISCVLVCSINCMSQCLLVVNLPLKEIVGKGWVT